MGDIGFIAKLISTIGMLTEGVGFVVLTVGVWSTNNKQAIRVRRLSEVSQNGSISADSILVSDGVRGTIRISGGAPAAFSNILKEMQPELNADYRRLVVGATLTAIGLLGQIVGTWSQ